MNAKNQPQPATPNRKPGAPAPTPAPASASAPAAAKVVETAPASAASATAAAVEAPKKARKPTMVREALTRSAKAFRGHITSMRNHNFGAIPVALFDAMLPSLDALDAEIAKIDPNLKGSNQGGTRLPALWEIGQEVEITKPAAKRSKAFERLLGIKMKIVAFKGLTDEELSAEENARALQSIVEVQFQRAGEVKLTTKILGRSDLKRAGEEEDEAPAEGDSEKK